MVSMYTHMFNKYWRYLVTWLIGAEHVWWVSGSWCSNAQNMENEMKMELLCLCEKRKKPLRIIKH